MSEDISAVYFFGRPKVELSNPDQTKNYSSQRVHLRFKNMSEVRFQDDFRIQGRIAGSILTTKNVIYFLYFLNF
jgi:hypothetical protein